MTKANIQGLYQSNEKFRNYVDHWAMKHNVSANEVMQYKITALVANMYLNGGKENEEVHIELKAGQDNGIA